MTASELTVHQPLVFKQLYTKPRPVAVLEIHETGNFVRVKPTHGKEFWCSPDQLSLPEPPPTPDPDRMTPGERTLYNILLTTGPLKTGELAAVVNGNPEQDPKWTASTVGMLARRLEKMGKVRMVKEGSQMKVEVA